MSEQPNILLIHADQHRGDCLGVENHPVLQTPTLDNMAANGARFSRFYAAAPSCIAARRSLLLGQTPQRHGIVGYRDGNAIPDDVPTLPGVLRNHGFQTYLVGRNMHQYPYRKLYGFDDMEMVTSPHKRVFNEYQEWYAQHGPSGAERQGNYGAGIMHNDWTAQPWHLPDHLHPTNWTVDRALRFMERRDPTRPYFLSVGFIAPHPPLQPPAFFFERYLRTGVPDPVIGDWAKPPADDATGDLVAADTVDLRGDALLCARAAYYGCINHIDTQLRRLLNSITGVGSDPNLIVIYLSDHGEGLGDHHLWRKSRAFECTARSPLIIQAPARYGFGTGRVQDFAATHADIMPTLLDMLGLDTPDTVDGKSLRPLLAGDAPPRRDYLHIEHTPYHHALTDGKSKYIWDPKDGRELFFALTNDPQEQHDLACRGTHDSEVATWRGRLIDALRDRPEGFVRSNALQTVGAWNAIIPGSQADHRPA